MENALISVCVPAYNAGKYIRDTLLSLAGQTYSNLEILVQDNASTDDTAAVVRNVAQGDPRIRLFQNESNIGYIRNIFTLVEKASGAIVCIYHADDIFERDIVERELEAIQETGASGAFGRYREFYRPDGRLIPYRIVPPFEEGSRWFCGGLEDYLPTILGAGNPFCCPSFMTKKDVFFRIGGFTDEYPSNEDLDLWLRYLAGGESLAIVNKHLLRYRHSEGQGSSYWDSRDELPAMFSVLEARIPDIETLPPDLVRAYKKNKAMGYLQAYRNAVRKKAKDKARRFARLSRETYLMGPRDGVRFLFQRLPGIFSLAKDVGSRIKRRG